MPRIQPSRNLLQTLNAFICKTGQLDMGMGGDIWGPRSGVCHPIPTIKVQVQV